MIIGFLRQQLRAALDRVRGGSSCDDTNSALRYQLTAALADLPETQRHVYLLHARDEVSLSEIADELQLSPLEAEQHLASALVHLDQIGTISARPGGAARAARLG